MFLYMIYRFFILYNYIFFEFLKPLTPLHAPTSPSPPPRRGGGGPLIHVSALVELFSIQGGPLVHVSALVECFGEPEPELLALYFSDFF